MRSRPSVSASRPSLQRNRTRAAENELQSHESRRRWRTGWPALRFRHRRYLRHHAFAHDRIRAEFQGTRRYSRHGSSRHDRRSDVRGHSRPKMGRARDTARPGNLLRGLGFGMCLRLGLGATEWRWQFGVAAVPAVLFLALLFGIPPSARWLVTQNRVPEARAVLQLMGAENPENELGEIVGSIHLERLRTSEPLFAWKYRFPIFLAISIGMFNQLSGINAILYYLNDIFAAAGFSKMSGELQSVAIGGMNLVATLLAMTVIDRIGRKTLLLIGSVGTAACLAGVARVFFTQSHQSYLLWLLVAYIAFFAISQGAVIWVYIGEVFPNRVRAKGQALGSSSHWIMNAMIAYTFPQLAKSSGAYPFVFFAAMMVVQFFVVLFFYPETKGVTLEQLQHRFGIE